MKLTKSLRTLARAPVLCAALIALAALAVAALAIGTTLLLILTRFK